MLNASESYRPKESTSLEMEKNPATARLGRKSGRKRDIITFRCWGSHDTPVIFHSTWTQRAAEEGNKKDGEPIQRLCARGCHSWESVVRDLTRKQCTGENISSCWFPDRHCSEPLIHALETRAASFRGARFASEKVLFSLVHHRNGTPFQNSANVTRLPREHGYVRRLIPTRFDVIWLGK